MTNHHAAPADPAQAGDSSRANTGPVPVPQAAQSPDPRIQSAGPLSVPPPILDPGVWGGGGIPLGAGDPNRSGQPYSTASPPWWHPAAAGPTGPAPAPGSAPADWSGGLPAFSSGAEQMTSARRRWTLIAAGTVLALGAGVAGGYAASSWRSTVTTATMSPLRFSTAGAAPADASPNGSVQAVAAAVLPSTVSVLASSAQGAGEGSGIVLTVDGLILTNNHVVSGATNLEVQFNDGTTSPATIIGRTVTDDLAVIRAQNTSGLLPATLGSSAALQVGQQVVAIGSPLGLAATVTSGIVSALNRPVRTSSADQSGNRSRSQDTVINAIQTDAAINPGNSGGALVDLNGSVIGINSAIASLSSSVSGQSGSIGVGFAIPIDQAARIAQEIISTGTASHALLGAAVSDAADSTGQLTVGATVSTVTAGSGADSAGLNAGDVITNLGGIKVDSADALIAAVRAQAPNSTVVVTYLRGGAVHTVEVTLGSATST